LLRKLDVVERQNKKNSNDVFKRITKLNSN